MEHKQAFLARVVSIGAELYAIAATCVRAYDDARDAKAPGRGKEAYELADAFARQSRHRVDRLFADLWSNTDSSDYDFARRVLDGRYAWQEAGILDKVPTDLPWIAVPETSASGSDTRR